jgi:glycosyltransferase involved in cell wall biosynthesis
MPVFNREWCVAEAIDSVLATNEPGLELLIVDDGSTDGTPRILADYAAREPERIRLFVHAGRANRGIASSRNLGVANSRGEYLAFLDSDDLYRPERFHHSLAWLEAHPQSAACVEPYAIASLNATDSARVVQHVTTVPPEDHGWLKAMLFANNYWNMPVITLRRSALAQFGAFDERLSFAEETALWLRLAAAQAVGAAQDHTPVAMVRRHSDHSWDSTDRVADRGTFLHVLLDALAWANGNTKIAPGAADPLANKLRTYLVEMLSDPALPLPMRLQAWQRSIVTAPRLAADRAVAANLFRAPFRRHAAAS